MKLSDNFQSGESVTEEVEKVEKSRPRYCEARLSRMKERRFHKSMVRFTIVTLVTADAEHD